MSLQDEVATIIDQNRALEGALLPVLHAIQARFGFVPPESEPELATALNLSLAEVRGVISFYHDFRTEPPGKHQVKICCAEACQARGSRKLAEHALASLGADFGETTEDNRITLEKVFCLGNCACGPSVAVGGQVFANVDPAGFDEVIKNLDSEQPA